jgi:hypothetical protein
MARLSNQERGWQVARLAPEFEPVFQSQEVAPLYF